MKTYAFAIALNGTEGSAWTSTGRGYPLFSGGKQATAESPVGITAMVDTRLSEVNIPNPQGNTPGQWIWVEPEKSVGSSTGEPSFAAVFFPTDTGCAPVRKNITLRVKAPVVVTIIDNTDTPEFEVAVQNAEADWFVAAVYSPEGQMLTCGQAAVVTGSSSLAIPLGEYKPQEGLAIQVFLLDERFIPQTAAAATP